MGLTMPLHDHPGMHVLLTVTKGKLLIATHTILSGRDQQLSRFPPQKSPRVALTCSREENTLTAGQCDLVDPVRNIHEIKALEDSQFVDVLFPDYAERDG
jgi:cysteamine dioxygenase